MAKAPRLKVFRTPIGFHDAYVAAPSRKAALAAWGSTADLFARGVAEEVSDPALTADPLARPGKVIRRSRGTAAEQFAALPPDPPRARREQASPELAEPAKSPTPKPPPKPSLPRPDRHPLDVAEQALSDADARHHAADRDLAAREAALAKERRASAVAHTAEQRDLEQARDDARRTYDRALAAWRQG